MKIRTLSLAGLTAAWLWPAVHAAAEESAQLAQIKARISDARQKSSGPFAEFAGVYDILKSCRRPPEYADAALGTMWLIAKSVFWFEGDDIVFFKFISPTNAERATLKFKQDYAIARDRTIKLYDVAWKAGGTDIMAFLPDRDLFDGKFIGRKFTFNYALRCGNEDQILDATAAILRVLGQ
jgi:hypothetical protein